jgi:hypothetical protein
LSKAAGTGASAGFRYWSFGEVGWTVSDGLPSPAAHDAKAAFKWGRKIRLVSNHEVRGAGTAFGVTPSHTPSSRQGKTDRDRYQHLVGTANTSAGNLASSKAITAGPG